MDGRMMGNKNNSSMEIMMTMNVQHVVDSVKIKYALSNAQLFNYMIGHIKRRLKFR